MVRRHWNLNVVILYSVSIMPLWLLFHITVAHTFPYAEQHHRPTTPNALEFPPGRLPVDHTEMSQTMLKQKINFLSPSMHTTSETIPFQ